MTEPILPRSARNRNFLVYATAALLVFSLLLCVSGLLFHFRITPAPYEFFKRLLGGKLPTAFFLIAPLITMILGLILSRRSPNRRLGKWAAGSGGVLLGTFLLLVGAASLQKAHSVTQKKNPSAPTVLPPLSGLPVFPGAEGFGTRTPAGRGGKVIFVTSLADDGPGTLRAALSQAGLRIVLFRVGGTIELTKPLYITHPFITVAGQTALGDGILIKNCGLVIAAHDVLIQHLRIRPGNEGKIEPDTNDAIQLLGKHGNVIGASNVVIDHVSASWGEDETVSVWYGAHDITISNCIISEALDRSRHRKGRHSAGLLIGDSSNRISVHNSLLAHNGFRNPLIAGGGTHDLVNNVIYNWGNIPAEILDHDSNTFLNFVGNTFIPGPSTESGPFEILINPDSRSGTPQIYVAGNIGPHRPTETDDDWQLVGYGWGSEGVAPDRYRSRTPFEVYPVTATSAALAYERVLASAGATLPKRDRVDQRVVSEVRNKSGRIINSPTEAGGYPVLNGAPSPNDSDNDGIPDEWELKHGLDPKDPSDAQRDGKGDGYTNIERYLHWLLTAASPAS